MLWNCVLWAWHSHGHIEIRMAVITLIKPSQGWTLTFSHGRTEGLTTGMRHTGTEAHESPSPGVNDGGLFICRQPYLVFVHQARTGTDRFFD